MLKHFYSARLISLLAIATSIFLMSLTASATHGVAHDWMETQLNCIRKDFARPTVQARNLCHASIVMYDAWAAFDDDASTFLLGKTWGAFTSTYNGIAIPADVEAAQEKCLSYAMYRFLNDRYKPGLSPGANIPVIQGYINAQMAALGYDPSITSTDYSDGDPAKLGNYIAAQMQLYALQDGSNQQNNYANLYYVSVNGSIYPQLPGNPGVVDPNRWQPLCLTTICDQGTSLENGDCIPLPCSAPALSPEWGNVNPFAMTEADKEVFVRDGHDWNIYHHPGAPPLLDEDTDTGDEFGEDFFKWGYCINSIWSSLHTLDDGVMVDISPAGIGNMNITDPSQLPTTFEEYKAFYNEFEGGDDSPGYDINPSTGLPYESQIVPRGDYTRVLSEFWADGPTSETPPGHWFTIANYVEDHPEFVKQWEGEGPILSDLEWEVRTYLALGGGIMDASIACWGAKGYYDYTRPIMALRYLAGLGQCTDATAPNYHVGGIPLIPGYIENVLPGDPLAGDNDENLYKIKVWSWAGPYGTPTQGTQDTGVHWILLENWWTYQRASFVTPPFPGYYSGHSTYSRTGAEILTLVTGDPYFPGGMGEFIANPGFLLADEGPSVQVKLQWAQYRDASDQCSLSRIYGSLHPPQDDIPGRKVGLVVGPDAFNYAESFINAGIPHVISITPSDNNVQCQDVGSTLNINVVFSESMNTAIDPTISFPFNNPVGTALIPNSGTWINSTTYQLSYSVHAEPQFFANVVVKVDNAQDPSGNANPPASGAPFIVQTMTCVGDFNCDGVSNVSDLLMFTANFGCQANCLADLTGDNVVNVSDLLVFSSGFGQVCN